MRLGGKAALITGGTSGMGRATALLFAREERFRSANLSQQGGAGAPVQLSGNQLTVDFNADGGDFAAVKGTPANEPRLGSASPTS